ncbi:MAG TPA: hypothetical protein VI413_10370, partial [Paludibacter sp.]
MRKCKATNVLNLCLFVLVTVLPVACKKEKVQEVPLGKVTQGTFYIDIYEEGEIEAIRSTNA